MLTRVPFVCFTAFLIAGILLGDYLIPANKFTSIILAFCPVAIGAISLFFYIKKSGNFGISFSIFLIFSGSLAVVLQNDRLENDLSKLSYSEYSAYEAVVKSLPEKRVKTIRMEVLIMRIGNKGQWFNENISALISIPVESSLVPKPGDYLIVNGKLDRAGKALNPEEFDYRNYLWNKGIVWTDYLPENSYFIQPVKNNPFNAGLWSTTISEWADTKFRENIKNDRSYGLVKAMLLGRRDDLRSDQVDDYTTSGTVHILSVSGMHVAIIFLVISMSLKWMKRWQAGKYIYLISVTSLLCFYALVTGLPPSVQRATLMCIVFVVAEAFGRKQSSMNTLAISAFLILIIDPHALYDVGFQLSFLAMAGIFLLYQPIDSIWQPGNPVLKYFWQITAMSFAAQLATFPLSLYYFHQFPFYFWLVNPFVILFTNFLLPAAMVLLLVSLFNFENLQFIANWWVEASAYLTNISVSVPKMLPGYLIENLYLDRVEVMLLYLALFAIWHSYYVQNHLIFKRAAFVVFLFIAYSFSVSSQIYLSNNAIIHSVPKHSVISFKEGDQLYISSDTAFQSDADSYKFHIKNYAISRGISEVIYLSNGKKISSENLGIRDLNNGQLLAWKDINIYHGKYASSFLPTNYCLINSGEIPKSLETHRNIKTTFLLGGQIRGKKNEKWTKYMDSQKYKFYDLSEGSLLLH